MTICKICGQNFTKTHGRQVCCSKECSRKFSQKQCNGTKIVNCIDCGNEIIVNKRASNIFVSLKHFSKFAENNFSEIPSSVFYCVLQCSFL